MTPYAVQAALAAIEARDAHYTLREHGLHLAEAMEPGEFYRRLTHAIAAADPHNRARLADAGFPGLVAAANLIQGSPQGVTLLRRRAGIPCPVCAGTGMVRDVDQAPGPDGQPSHLKTCPDCGGDTAPPRTQA